MVRSKFMVSVTMSDLASLAIAMVAASVVVYGVAFPWNGFTSGSVFPMLAFMGVSMIAASAITARMSGPGVPRPTYGRMVAIWALTLMFTAGLIFLFRNEYFSRPFVALAGTFWLVPATIHRFIRRQRPWTEKFGVITREKSLADELHSTDHAEVLWVMAPDAEAPIDLPERDVTIAVDLGAVLSESIARYLSSADVAGYRIRPFASSYEEHTGRVALVHLSEGWEISAPLLEVAHWLPGKRLVDTVLTVVTAPIWGLLGLMVAGYVRLTDGSGPLFLQERVGLNGQAFTMFKFRTMDVDAERHGARFATEDDPRVIRGGTFLRKSRLDEIPQLWNVLKGEMSLVGPRAEQVPFVSEFSRQIPFYDHRHMVRPGITGWAQVNYGYADGEADTIEKLTYDLFYIKHMSPVMDLRILWNSIWTVLTGAGAR